MTTATVSPELLEILRCPRCVSGETRMPGDDPGRLELVRNDTWLVSHECGLKYPIKEGIPVMLIEEGMKWKDTPIEALPDSGPLIDSQEMSRPDTPFTSSTGSGPDPKLFMVLGVAAALIVFVFVIMLTRRKY